jgi:hypothetical protein
VKRQGPSQRVQELHKAIAICAAGGMLDEAQSYWEQTPVRYRAAMSLCMYLGRLRKPVSRDPAHARSSMRQRTESSVNDPAQQNATELQMSGRV